MLRRLYGLLLDGLLLRWGTVFDVSTVCHRKYSALLAKTEGDIYLEDSTLALMNTHGSDTGQVGRRGFKAHVERSDKL